MWRKWRRVKKSELVTVNWNSQTIFFVLTHFALMCWGLRAICCRLKALMFKSRHKHFYAGICANMHQSDMVVEGLRSHMCCVLMNDTNYMENNSCSTFHKDLYSFQLVLTPKRPITAPLLNARMRHLIDTILWLLMIDTDSSHRCDLLWMWLAKGLSKFKGAFEMLSVGQKKTETKQFKFYMTVTHASK